MTEAVQIKAKLGHLRISPRKVRLVADLLRGLEAEAAVAQLRFINKGAAQPLLKLLNSALANAKNNFDLEKEVLFVEKIFVNAGPTLKRWLPRAMGRATQLRKRSCQVELILGQKEGTAVKSRKKESGKPEITHDKLKEGKAAEKIIMEEEQKTERQQKEKRPHGASGSAKYKNFSRQPAVAGDKKVFRRKSI